MIFLEIGEPEADCNTATVDSSFAIGAHSIPFNIKFTILPMDTLLVKYQGKL